MNFEFVENKHGAVYHEMVNISCKKNKSIPHEWYFINKLYKDEIFKNKDLALIFENFIFTYYPDFQWNIVSGDNSYENVTFNCYIHDFNFMKIFDCDFNDGDLTKSMEYGDIVTDFLIRYRGYSLIKCSGQKIVLTARSDCHKRFEPLLNDGYCLQRRSKIGFVRFPEMVEMVYPQLKNIGFFYRLPVLPTREIGYPIDEIIEVPDGSRYERVL